MRPALQRSMCRPGTDGQNSACALRTHLWKHGFHTVEHTLEVDVDHRPPNIRINVFYPAHRRDDPGVVDHDIDTAKGFDSLCDRAFNSRVVRHITSDGQGLWADLGSQIIQRRLSSRQKRDIGPFSGKGASRCCTDALAGPRDHHCFAVQIRHNRSF